MIISERGNANTGTNAKSLLPEGPKNQSLILPAVPAQGGLTQSYTHASTNAF
jgi:hypothetical protein